MRSTLPSKCSTVSKHSRYVYGRVNLQLGSRSRSAAAAFSNSSSGAPSSSAALRARVRVSPSTKTKAAAASAQQQQLSTTSSGTMPASVTVFSTPGCKYCKRAKEALASAGVAYADIDVSRDPQLRQALAEATTARTVPQIFANGALVGGSDELVAALDSGRLKELLLAGDASGSSSALPASLAAAVERAAAAAPPLDSAAPSVARLPAELEPLAAAIADASNGIVAFASRGGDSTSGSKTFTGKQLIDWLAGPTAANAISSGSGGSNPREVAAALLAANAMTRAARALPDVATAATIEEAAEYRLRADAPRTVEWGAPLNAHYWWGPSPARPAGIVAEDLRGRIAALYDAHLSGGGRGVDYKGMASDPNFWRYVDATAELQRVDLGPLTRDELTAFAINLYNALIIHTLVAHGTARYESAAGRLSFFTKGARYLVGGSVYSADDLENGILRGNSPAASSIGMLLGFPALSQGPFVTGDPRRAAVVPPPVDARIHFALVCGARSCPPVQVYSPDNLEEGLAAAAAGFCAGDVEVDAAAKRVTLSKIFQWYAPDFGATKADRLRYLLPHLPADRAARLAALLDADPAARRISVVHRAYDWGINDAGK